MEKQKKSATILVLALFCYLILASICYSQNYKINPEDILRITFLDKPEFNRETQVGLDGKISLPVVGSVQAAGLTTRELAQKIVSEFSIYAVRLVQVSVEVLSYESNKVYVTGNITRPGKYVFEKIPNLWSVISEAGGPLENANLSNVLIIRSAKAGGATIPVDLKEIIKKGNMSRLPKLKPGDNIHLPAVISGDVSHSIESPQQQRTEIYIYGEIANPGIYTFDDDVDILQLIIKARGPKRDAKEKDVRVIRRMQNQRTKVIRVNIKRYVDGPRSGFFKLQSGDIVYIPRKKSLKEGIVGSIVFSLILPITISAIIYEVIRGNR